MVNQTMYAVCGKCKEGYLIPVNLGKGGERMIKYRCTNPDCNVRFDEHGYERFDSKRQIWIRV